jgi:hypothetical protein
MATNNEFKFHSGTVGKNKSIHAGFDLETQEWEAKQDITEYINHAKLERDKQDYFGKRTDGYRKMATIPDIVAIKILQDHKLDLHDPEFMGNPSNLTRLKKILMSEYSDLLVNT